MDLAKKLDPFVPTSAEIIESPNNYVETFSSFNYSYSIMFALGLGGFIGTDFDISSPLLGFEIYCTMVGGGIRTMTEIASHRLKNQKKP